MDIPINARVSCTDGPCGHSTHVVLMPTTEKITHLVVNKEVFPETEYLVPIEHIAESTPEMIRLDCSCAELEKMPVFDKVTFLPYDLIGLTAGSYVVWPYFFPETPIIRKGKDHIPANELVIRRGAGVEATDGHIGRVDEFLIDPESDGITHLVLTEGHLWEQKDVSIPVGQIDHYKENTVYLKLDKHAIEALPAIPILHGQVKKPVVIQREANPMDIPINAKVNCSDGLFGQTTHLIIMPTTEKITHVIVVSEFYPETRYLVPVERIVESTPESIQLSCTRDEVLKMPVFNRVEFIPSKLRGFNSFAYMMWPYYPLEASSIEIQNEPIPANEFAIRRGAQVEATDGHVGWVGEFLIDPKNDTITHLVLREGHLWGQKDVSIPVGQIDRYQDNTVYLKMNKHAIEALPKIPIHRGATRG
jgi:sporulation protein YlmC with PRC-barrel domain